jgi:hypothetical protein
MRRAQHTTQQVVCDSKNFATVVRIFFATDIDKRCTHFDGRGGKAHGRAAGDMTVVDTEVTQCVEKFSSSTLVRDKSTQLKKVFTKHLLG